MELKLFDSERKVMEVLWDQGADLPARVYTLPLSIFTVLLAVPVLAALLWRRKEGTYGDDA